MIVTQYIYTGIQVCEQQKMRNYHMYAKYRERFHMTTQRPLWCSKTITLEIELLIYAETFFFGYNKFVYIEKPTLTKRF